MSKSGLTLALALLAAWVAPSSAGNVYRWEDADGKVHYGDRPPLAGGGVQTLDVEGDAPPADPQAADRARKRQRLLDAYDTERERRRTAAATRAEALAERARNCARARRRLSSVEQANVIFQRNEAGERTYLDDTQRQKLERSVRADVKEWCR